MANKQQYYFCGEDVVQNFPMTQSAQYKSDFHDQSKSLFESTLPIHKPFDKLEDTNQQKDIRQPIDLGLDIFITMRDEFFRRNKIKTNDPRPLFDLWQKIKTRKNAEKQEQLQQQLKKSEKLYQTGQQYKQINTETQQRLTQDDKGFKINKNEKLEEKALLLKTITNFRADDVKYTLSIHGEKAEKDVNVSKFFDSRMSDETKKKAKKHNPKAQQRLYSSLNNFHKEQKVDPCKQFALKICELHRSNYPDSDYYKTPEILYKYWLTITDRKYYPEIDTSPEKAQEYLDIYYFDKMNELHELFVKKQGYISTSVKQIVKFWKDKINEQNKINMGVDFESEDNLKFLVEWFFLKQQQKEQSELSLYEQQLQPKQEPKKDKKVIFTQKLIEMHKKQQPDNEDYKTRDILYSFWETINNRGFYKELDVQDIVAYDYLNDYFRERVECIYQLYIKNIGQTTQSHKIIFQFWKEFLTNDNKKEYGLDWEQDQTANRTIQEYFPSILQKEQQKLDKLSKPKNQLQIGKTLLNLQKMFPKDTILSKMILNEFKTNKVIKYPQEYDNYDSDEEYKIQGQSQHDKPKDKLNSIAQLFQEEMSKYYEKKQDSLQNSKIVKKGTAQEDRLLQRFLKESAKTFIEFRKSRFEEKVPTLNEFLSKIYQEAKKKYKDSTQRKFPHRTYGEFKTNKKKSYPYEFKRQFFFTVKLVLKKQVTRKLPFWAPPSGSGKCRIHDDNSSCPLGCTHQTYNKTVQAMSKEAKQVKQLSRKPPSSSTSNFVWDQKEFIDEKKQFFMQQSEQINCTFHPHINENKDASKRQKPDIKRWVEAMGENLSKFPMVYKFGVLKRCVLYYQEGDYQKAYKKMVENFDLNMIKQKFDQNFDPKKIPLKNPQSMYSYENLAFEEDKMPKTREQYLYDDKKEKTYNNFYMDVFTFIQYLEQYDRELRSTQKELQKKIKDEKIKQLVLRKNSKNKTSQQHSHITAHTYEDRKEQVKEFMCPLKEKCPDFIGGRWPISDTKTTNTLGSNCIYAHHLYELKFEQEKKTKKKMLQDMLKATQDRIHQSANQQKPWNPAGNKIVDCAGCGSQIGKTGSKGLCAYCGLHKSIAIKLNDYRKKAKITNQDITKSKKFQENQKESNRNDVAFNQKLGFLSRAQILYSKERFAEAFKVIGKAIQMVKAELEKNFLDDQKQERKWEKNLQVDKDPFTPLTQQMVYSELNQSMAYKMAKSEDYNPGKAQKLVLLAQKTNVLEPKSENANHFVNHQIELLYLKIEKQLVGKVQDLKLMKELKRKIDKKQEFSDDEDEEFVNKKYKKLGGKQRDKECPTLQSTGKCPTYGLRIDGCQFAHSKTQLDIIPDSIRQKELVKTIHHIESTIQQYPPPVQWVPGTKASAKFDANYYDKQQEIKKYSTMDEKKANKIKIKKEKTIYDRDIDDLTDFDKKLNINQ